MNQLKLNRKIEIKKFRGIIDIGRQVEKESYISILKLAEEQGGKVEAKDIIEKFFKGRPEHLGRQIIYRCYLNELLTIDGYLTEEGKLAIKSNKIYMKENGAYNFWTTKDPLIQQILLNLKEINVYKMGEHSNEKKMVDIPDWIKNLENNKIKLFNKKNEVIEIYRFHDKIQMMENDLDVIIHYIVSPAHKMEDSKLIMNGDLKKELYRVPEYTFEEIWHALLGDESNRWDLDNNAYKCKLDEIDKDSRLNFKIEKSFKKPKILDLGQFNDIKVKNIPIIPMDSLEANKWAIWILEQQISDYLDNRDYLELCSSIKNMKPFNNFKISFPTQLEMTERFVEKDSNGDIKFLEKFWYLKSPLELEPRIVNED